MNNTSERTTRIVAISLAVTLSRISVAQGRYVDPDYGDEGVAISGDEGGIFLLIIAGVLVAYGWWLTKIENPRLSKLLALATFGSLALLFFLARTALLPVR